MNSARTPRYSLGQAAPPNCPSGYNVTSSPPDAAGNVHQYCVRGKTAFIYDAIGLIGKAPGAYADIITHPTAGYMPARLTSLATGVLGIVGLVKWIRRGRSAPTHVKVGTPLLIVTSLAAAGFRNGVG
jgi:hypothetical protein